jgi:preflagellin peptidase FlaK
MQTIFIAAKVAVSLIFLLYASWSDYKTREVSNRVWLFYAPIALALSLVEFLLYDSSLLPFFGLSVGLTFLIAFVLFYSGGFGGADSKAFMCIALALPFSTDMLFSPLIPQGLSPLAQLLFPIVIFSNSVLIAAASAGFILLKNIFQRLKEGKEFFEGDLKSESFGKKIVVLITGYRMSISKLKEKWHIYPMEDIETTEKNTSKRKLIIVPKEEGRNEIVDRLDRAIQTKTINDYVWSTPGLPMLIFVTIGLIIAILFGDIVWMVISYFLN